MQPPQGGVLEKVIRQVIRAIMLEDSLCLLHGEVGLCSHRKAVSYRRKRRWERKERQGFRATKALCFRARKPARRPPKRS